MDSAIDQPDDVGVLSRSKIVAQPGFNRWLVPPAALAIHLCIGMAYGFSVFWLPLTHALNGQRPVACAADSTLLQRLATTSCDWLISDLTWIYTLFFIFLGSSAAIWGGWLERAGPRRAGLAAVVCWCGGMAMAAFGIYLHQLWVMWGAAMVCGVGLGLGYISPVSTLIKWFPDRRGMATGMAIMGFGGGALVGTPLATELMARFATPTTVGVAETFLAMAAIYAAFMLAGALGDRVPPAEWAPERWTAPARARTSAARGHVALRNAHRTPQFWLIWLVLLFNVSATIGIIGYASPMLQEVFGGRLAGRPELGFSAVQADPALKGVAAAVAGGFVGFIGVFNIGGRFAWASASDRLGRKPTFMVILVLSFALYAVLPAIAAGGNLALFTFGFALIASMYGGGFATVPAYLADVFGTHYVGAIHGRLLTAWSLAGIFGPRLIASLHTSSGPNSYDAVFFALAGLLLLGLLCNLLVRPVASRWLMSAPELAAAQPATAAQGSSGIGRGGFTPASALAWAAVGIPLAIGLFITLRRTLALFQ